MQEYDVEVLVHLNRTVRVSAGSSEEALRLARQLEELVFPLAALVDATDWVEAETPTPLTIETALAALLEAFGPAATVDTFVHLYVDKPNGPEWDAVTVHSFGSSGAPNQMSDELGLDVDGVHRVNTVEGLVEAVRARRETTD